MLLIEDEDIAIRSMEDAEDDYGLMYKWLTDDRVLEYYGGRDKKYTIESIKQKYSPRVLGKDNITPCIIEYQKNPIGYIQFYPDPQPDSVFGSEKNIIGIDLFIGEPEYWSKGFGSRSLRMIVDYLFNTTSVSKLIVDPNVNNLRAIHAYEKAGFRKLKIIRSHEPYEGAYPSAWLMVCEKDEKVHIESYNPIWPKKFITEKKLIEEKIAPWIEGGIHHVGSTAIPGLPSKAIVDIMVGVKNLEEAKACISILETIGYCYHPYRPYMHWFCKPTPAHREFHLQLMEPTNSQWKARLYFRNYLRTNPEVAQEYAKLKMQLAEKFPDLADNAKLTL